MNTEKPEFNLPVQRRYEGESIPEGVSCTRTVAAYYVRIREGNKCVTIRVSKDLADFSMDKQTWSTE